MRPGSEQAAVKLWATAWRFWTRVVKGLAKASTPLSLCPADLSPQTPEEHFQSQQQNQQEVIPAPTPGEEPVGQGGGREAVGRELLPALISWICPAASSVRAPSSRSQLLIPFSYLGFFPTLP